MARKKKTERGVLLVALGHSAYYQMAYNIALTIKDTSPGVGVCILAESPERVIGKHLSLYETVIPIERKDMEYQGKVSPARIKSRIAQYTPFKKTLYLDVDGFVINDLNVLFEALEAIEKAYVTSVIDYGTLTKKDYEYNIWATNEDIWAHFGLNEDATIPSLNSSFCYFNDSAEAKALMKKVHEYDENRLPYEKLRWTWGKRSSPRDVYPDELTYMAACAACAIDPKIGIDPVLFSSRPVNSWEEVKKKYFVVALYGGSNTTHPSIWKYYERYMANVSKRVGGDVFFRAKSMIQNKHANGK